MTASPFTLSIEPTDKPAFQHGFHLGTDEQLARQLAEEMFHNRNKYGKPTCTVALMRNAHIVDVYDGIWSSEFAADALDDRDSRYGAE